MQTINCNKLNSEYTQTAELKIGNIVINADKLQLLSNTVIKVGQNTFTFKEVVEMVEYMKKVEQKCGKNLEKCQNQQSSSVVQ